MESGEIGFHISQAALELTVNVRKAEDDFGLLIFLLSLPECWHTGQALYRRATFQAPHLEYYNVK